MPEAAEKELKSQLMITLEKNFVTLILDFNEKIKTKSFDDNLLYFITLGEVFNMLDSDNDNFSHAFLTKVL